MCSPDTGVHHSVDFMVKKNICWDSSLLNSAGHDEVEPVIFENKEVFAPTLEVRFRAMNSFNAVSGPSYWCKIPLNTSESFGAYAFCAL